MNPSFVKNAIASLLTMFEQQSFPETIAHMILRRKAGDIKPQSRWSIGNQLIALCVGGTTDARTFLQWKSVGRYPRKGSTCFHIFAPATRKIDLEPDANGDSRSALRLLGFKPLPVFAVESTDGSPVEVFDYTPPELPPLWSAGERLGLKVSYAPFDGRTLGKYRPDEKRIILSTSDAAVWFHELSHAVHNTFERLRPGMLQRAEITAELSSAVLLELSGITGYQHSAYKYIRHFSQGKDDTAVMQTIMTVLSDVEKVVGIIWNAGAESAETAGAAFTTPDRFSA